MRAFVLTLILLTTIFCSAEAQDTLSLFKSFAGDESGAYYGWSACGVNLIGDEYPELIIGTPMRNSSRGAVFIYRGGPDMDSLPDFIIEGEEERDQFGISVSPAGDFNGDGFSDLLVGANVSLGIGKAYIFFGGPAFDGIPDVEMAGREFVDNYGYAVTGLGDINGDGFDDVAVGALYNDALGDRTGQVYIYFGGETADGEADIVLTGLDSLNDFGCDLDGGYDINGDGAPDLIVGSVQAGRYWEAPGLAEIFFGGELLDTIPDVIVSGEDTMDFFGGVVAGLGDMNGDGYDDFASGAYHHHGDAESSGKVYVYLGGEETDSIPDLIIEGHGEEQNLGTNTSSVGDINGDGFFDLAVASSYDPITGTPGGMVSIYFGGESLDTIPDIVMFAENYGDRFGWSIRRIGDINGDGYEDIVITAARADCYREDDGKAYIYLGYASNRPPEAELLSPPIGAISSCPDQKISFLITDDGEIDAESIHLLVNGVEYTADSPELSLSDSLLEFYPTSPFSNGDTIRFSLINLSDTEGACIGEPVSGYFIVDTEPPLAEVISPSPGSILTIRQPEIMFVLWDNISGVDYDSLTFIINDSVVSIPDSALTFAGDTLIISTVKAGIILEDRETLSICLTDIMDSPDICSPNRLDGAICTEFEVNLVFTCELVVSSFPLNPQRLYFGLARGATDGFDFLVDRIMLPPIGASVDAKFYIEDERYYALHHLANDYRGTDSDTTVWCIETSGEGDATVSWNPEMLGEGVFLLNNWLDMKSYDSFRFTLGETLTIHFFFKPQIEFPIQLSNGWNLVSLPVYPSSYRTDELFPSLAFVYDNPRGCFFAPERHITGSGYFVHSSLPETTLIVGIPIEKIRTELFPGWNLISATNETTSLPDGLVIPPAYRFRTSPPLYLPETELSPGNGYWVLSRGEGMLDIPAEGTRYLLSMSDDSRYLKTFGALPPFITQEDSPHSGEVFIYPNPFNSTVRFSAPDGKIERIEIFNINGELVFHSEAEGKTVSWEPKSLPSGMYLVRVKAPGKTFRTRVLFLR
ncbi:MAG: hypothetical protein B6D65_03750 [candidate division Zixibacteria bacterium 4484_93]|nr:MAG: hypothetical protein B6D65_03750 [candidate division Zixibacteria bacterium 4484_93]